MVCEGTKSLQALNTIELYTKYTSHHTRLPYSCLPKDMSSDGSSSALCLTTRRSARLAKDEALDRVFAASDAVAEAKVAVAAAQADLALKRPALQALEPSPGVSDTPFSLHITAAKWRREFRPLVGKQTRRCDM